MNFKVGQKIKIKPILALSIDSMLGVPDKIHTITKITGPVLYVEGYLTSLSVDWVIPAGPASKIKVKDML